MRKATAVGRILSHHQKSLNSLMNRIYKGEHAKCIITECSLFPHFLSILLGVPLKGQPVGLVLHPFDQLPLEPGVPQRLTHPPLKICKQLCSEFQVMPSNLMSGNSTIALSLQVFFSFFQSIEQCLYCGLPHRVLDFLPQVHESNDQLSSEPNQEWALRSSQIAQRLETFP